MSIRTLALTLATIAATCFGFATANAASNRTWVSAGGSNNTACNVSTPCQTFAQALAVTSSGGEINCMSPGDFGAVTITISVTINCEGASNGGIIVTELSAVTINTAGIIVNLIGLDLNGRNAGSGPGVEITAAADVTIRNCKIYGFVNAAEGYGINFEPSASGGTLVVDNTFIAHNNVGIGEYIYTGAANMTVRNSTISNNVEDGIYISMGGGTHAGATIEQTTLAFNIIHGLTVSGSGAIAVIGNSTVVNNGTGVSAASGGILYSFKNNQIGGNSTDGTPLTAYPGGPLN
jgi:Right handed beta helix region